MKKKKRNSREPDVRLYTSKLDDLREMCEWIERNPDKPPAFVPKHLQYLVPWNASLCGWGNYWGLFEHGLTDYDWRLNLNWRDVLVALEIAGRPVRALSKPITGEQKGLI